MKNKWIDSYQQEINDAIKTIWQGRPNNISGLIRTKTQEALNSHESQVNQYIYDTLGVQKMNTLSKLKLKLQGVNIKRYYLGNFRERIEIYKGNFMISSAEFNITLKT